MCLPFVCVLGLLTVACAAGLQALSAHSPWYRLLFYHAVDVAADSAAEESEPSPAVVDGVRTDPFPRIAYQSLWATLRVEGWEKHPEVPVYYGDDYSLLKKGAGMWQNSRFCGQNGKTVLSAHCTTHFRELEDTPVGTQITMETIYGTYVYEVTERVLFTPDAPEILYPADGEDCLVLYTCYPYDYPSYIRPQRLALVCKKLSGEVFADYVR